MRAAELVGTEEADRRVLRLHNPDLYREEEMTT
jgi:hypothetical protein